MATKSTKATKNWGVQTFNFIRNNSTEAFMEIVPSATSDNISTLSNILFNDAYAPQLNEFVTNLVNRIALTIVRNKSFNNPLAIFKKGSIPLGTDVQEIFTNPAKAQKYEYSNTAMSKILTIMDPDTKVAYYQRNRQDMYQKTISREGLQGAFVSWEKFNEFISSITNSLYSGNYIDEFKYTKELIDGAYDNRKIITQVVTNPVDEASGNAFLKTVRGLYDMMTFPSSDYNAYSKFKGNENDTPVISWTEPDRIVLIVRADIMATVDVDSLARAFNIERADFIGRVIKVDKFENPEIVGLICDEAFFQIYDSIFRFDEQYIASTMAWNLFLHAWSTFAISPFANAVLLVTSQNVPATNVSMPTTTSVTVGADANVTITLTPSTATTDVTSVTSSDQTVATAKLNGNNVVVTGVKTGTSTVTIKTDNGLTASTTVTVTE